MEEVIVYSCCTPGYDNPVQDGRIYISPPEILLDKRKDAKLPKIFPEIYLPEHKYSIWVDANIELLCNPQKLIDLIPYSKTVAVFKHPFRDTIQQEIEACKGLDSEKNLMYHSHREGELAACGIIIRKSAYNNRFFQDAWFKEIVLGSCRDQLSFPYTLGLISHYIKEEIRQPFDSKYFKRHPHIHEISGK